VASIEIRIVPGGYEVIARDEEDKTLVMECRDFGAEMNPDEVVTVLASRTIGICRDMNRDPEWRYQSYSKTQPAHVYRCGFPESGPLCGHTGCVARLTNPLAAASDKRKYAIGKCADCGRLLNEHLIVQDDKGA